MRTEWAAAAGALGPQLRAALGEALRCAETTIQNLISHDATAAERQVADADITALLDALGTDAASRAAWRDLLETVERNAPLAEAWSRRRILEDALNATGHDLDSSLKLVTQILDDSAYAIAEANVRLGRSRWPDNARKLIRADAGLAPDERLRLASDILGSQPRSGHCVVWLAFANAQLGSFIVEAGAITLVDAEWAVPNVTEGGQDFPHRDELALVHELPDADNLKNIVLVRVDLGVRPLAGAKSAAIDAAEVIIQASTSSRSVGTWTTFGWRVTFLDDAAIGSEHFVPEQERASWVHGYKLDEVAERLDELGSRLDRAVATAEMPLELREAIRTSAQAHTADSTGRLLLHYRVLELISGLAGDENVDMLVASIAAHWPVSVWRALCMDAVVHSHHAWTRSGEALPDFVRDARRNTTGRGFVVDFAQAGADPIEMTRHLRSRCLQANARRLLESLTDPVTALEELARIQSGRKLLTERLGRVRNALVHGNPIHPDVVESLDEYAEYLAWTATREALERHMDGEDLATFLQNERRRVRTFVHNLRDGQSPMSLWTARSSD